MHLLVLGATGAIGSRFCDLALQQGHKLTLFVRTRNKISSSTLQHEGSSLVEGTLDDEAALETASRCGAETFVSFAGPPVGSKGTPLAAGYRALIPKLTARGFQRVLILGTPSFRSQADDGSLKWWVGEWTMKVVAAGQYKEIVAIGEYVSSLLDGAEVECTFFRVGGLTNKDEMPVLATHVGSGKDAMWISRASVARWVLDEVEGRRWIGKMPYICN